MVRCSREETCGVFLPTASRSGTTFCSSSYPHAGQTNPSQQKYGTVNLHAGHCVVAMSPPPARLSWAPTSPNRCGGARKLLSTLQSDAIADPPQKPVLVQMSIARDPALLHPHPNVLEAYRTSPSLSSMRASPKFDCVWRGATLHWWCKLSPTPVTLPALSPGPMCTVVAQMIPWLSLMPSIGRNV
jgi:hypothetical protein